MPAEDTDASSVRVAANRRRCARERVAFVLELMGACEQLSQSLQIVHVIVLVAGGRR